MSQSGDREFIAPVPEETGSSSQARYPPFDITHVLRYTNRQIRFYIQTVSMTVTQQKQLKDALINRDAIMSTTGWDGESNHDEEEEEDDDDDEAGTIGSRPSSRTSRRGRA